MELQTGLGTCTTLEPSVVPLQAVEDFGEEEEEGIVDIASEDKARDPLHQAMIRRTADGVEFTGVVVDIQCGKMTGEMLHLLG